MKAVKFLSMFVVALVMSLSFSSCSKDDDEPTMSSSISELKDTGTAFTYTYTEKVFTMTVTHEVTYGYKLEGGVKIVVSHKEVTTWPDADMAQDDYDGEISDPDNDYTVTLDGNKVIYEYKSSEFEDMTEDEVRFQYSLRKSIVEDFNSYLS